MICGYLFCLALVTSYGRADFSNMLEPCDEGICRAGERFNSSSNVCLACDNGTYIDVTNHSCENCRPCTRPEISDMEIVDAECTPVSDTVIGCEAGHYRAAGTNDMMFSSCEPCSKCGAGYVVARRCAGENNTVCKENTTANNSTQSSGSDDRDTPSVVIVIMITLTVTGLSIAALVVYFKLKTRRRFAMVTIEEPYRIAYQKMIRDQANELNADTQL
ncbi:hypothetical protein Btru_072109 [Bulinus truncatus]|nr:hypothetical protein Btru_072109 [Bulinus truncatus]